MAFSRTAPSRRRARASCLWKDESFREVFKRADGLMYERRLRLKCMGAVTRD